MGYRNEFVQPLVLFCEHPNAGYGSPGDLTLLTATHRKIYAQKAALFQLVLIDCEGA